MTRVVCQLQECPRYRQREQPMALLHERAESWLFQCPVCRNVRLVHKRVIGGTLGAGHHEDGRRSVLGRGF